MTPQEQETQERAGQYAETISSYSAVQEGLIQAFIAGYTADRWIDCKVRMPEELQEVLFARYGGKYFGFYSAREECWYSDRFTEGTSVGVTHWQPLPEPPKTNE